MEDGQIETFDSKIHKMKDYEKIAEKNKTQRANKATKTKRRSQGASEAPEGEQEAIGKSGTVQDAISRRQAGNGGRD